MLNSRLVAVTGFFVTYVILSNFWPYTAKLLKYDIYLA
jgi:hypothetical protein